MLAPPSQACDGLSTRMCRPRAGSPRTARFEALGRLSPHIRTEGFAASGAGAPPARYPHERAPEADTRPVAVAAVISAVRRPRSPRLVTGCTDEQLARRVSDGDEAAFEAIYDRYAPGLLAFCRQLLGDPQEAEDALQQSFARVYSALRSGRGPSSVKPWVYAIARNRCLTLLAARRVVIDLDAVRGAVPPTEDCYAEVQRRADVGELVDDLHRLPDDQRVALVLFELGGHSQNDIAEVLEVVPARVKALVFQAREGLARAREARAAVCRDVLEELAVLRGPAPRRGPLADHLARCAACSAFASEMGRQRRALAVVILPAVPPVALKAKVLGTALTGGGGTAVAVGGAGGSGGAGAIMAATGGGAAAGGGALAVAGAGGAGTLGAAAAGTAGLAGVGGVAAGLAAKGVVAKILTAVAVAGSATAMSVAPTARPPRAVGPTSIAPIVAEHPGLKPKGPADEPHTATLPS